MSAMRWSDMDYWQGGALRDPVHGGQQLARIVTAGTGGTLTAPLVDIAKGGAKGTTKTA
jgi:hypothetical protein